MLSDQTVGLAALLMDQVVAPQMAQGQQGQLLLWAEVIPAWILELERVVSTPLENQRPMEMHKAWVQDSARSGVPTAGLALAAAAKQPAVAALRGQPAAAL